jgi:hypothetical protein
MPRIIRAGASDAELCAAWHDLAVCCTDIASAIYHRHHRAVEFLKFLKEIDAQVPEGLNAHLVMDNYAAYKTPKIKAWLARRPHYQVDFTTTSVPWIRSSVGSLSSPANRSGEVSTRPSGSSRAISLQRSVRQVEWKTHLIAI